MSASNLDDRRADDPPGTEPAPVTGAPATLDRMAAPTPAGWRGIWTARRVRIWLAAAIAAAYLPLLGVPFRGWLDFSAFYAAGSLAGRPEVAQLVPIVRFQQERGLPITPFVYPAGAALAYVPFSWLPYDVAAASHALLMLVLLVVAARLGADILGLPRRWAILGALAWSPAAAGVASGQNTSVALLLVVLAARSLQRAAATQRPATEAGAGLATGLLAYKPQLAAPLVGLLLLRWRAVALVGVAVALLAHYLLGIVATGGNAAWPLDWVATLQGYAGEDLRANGWQAVSLPAFLGRFDQPGGAPLLTALGYLGGGALVVACLTALRRWPVVDAVALACAAGLVISPHAWVYDATLLLPALAVYARRAAERGWRWQDRWLLALGYAIGLTWPLGGFIGATAVIAVVVAAPILLLRSAGAPCPGTFAHPVAVPAGSPRA